MKIGIVPINVGGSNLADEMLLIAQAAESSGIESLWTFEHAMVPTDYESKYPYSRSGKMPVTPETWFVDPLVSLSFIAGATSTIRLATGINILPQTNPLLFAKQTASLDVLSNGRLTLGLGVGWLAEEFDAMGTPFAGRGRRFRDYLAAIKKVWSGDVVEHSGEFVNWSGFKSYPTPAQRPHPPLVMGGVSAPALRRVVEIGDGWYSPNHNIDQFREQHAQLVLAADKAGRAMDTIEVTATWVLMKEPDKLAAYEDLGVSRLIVPLFATGEGHWKKAIEKLATFV